MKKLPHYRQSGGKTKPGSSSIMSKIKSKKWGWRFGKRRKNAYSLNPIPSSLNTRQSSLNGRPYGVPTVREMDVKFATNANGGRNKFQKLGTFTSGEGPKFRRGGPILNRKVDNRSELPIGKLYGENNMIRGIQVIIKPRPPNRNKTTVLQSVRAAQQAEAAKKAEAAKNAAEAIRAGQQAEAQAAATSVPPPPPGKPRKPRTPKRPPQEKAQVAATSVPPPPPGKPQGKLKLQGQSQQVRVPKPRPRQQRSASEGPAPPPQRQPKPRPRQQRSPKRPPQEKAQVAATSVPPRSASEGPAPRLNSQNIKKIIETTGKKIPTKNTAKVGQVYWNGEKFKKKMSKGNISISIEQAIKESPAIKEALEKKGTKKLNLENTQEKKVKQSKKKPQPTPESVGKELKSYNPRSMGSGITEYTKKFRRLGKHIVQVNADGVIISSNSSKATKKKSFRPDIIGLKVGKYLNFSQV